MTFLKTVCVTAVTLAALALPSMADDWRGGRHGGGGGDWHGGGGGWRGGSRVSIGIGVPIYAPAPYYYGPRYYGPAYYEPGPVVVGREVGGDVTVDVQRMLARKGYYNGVVDGELGPRSRAAIRAWQADVGLPVTGSLNAATLRSLGLL